MQCPNTVLQNEIQAALDAGVASFNGCRHGQLREIDGHTGATDMVKHSHTGQIQSDVRYIGVNGNGRH